uniref:Uncharacterized protein MANES_15G094800 n=1 Tax=Rhizophora mucronata TaxID=61149 RepID=A0A2P2PIG3_RHIMU
MHRIPSNGTSGRWPAGARRKPGSKPLAGSKGTRSSVGSSNGTPGRSRGSWRSPFSTG